MSRQVVPRVLCVLFFVTFSKASSRVLSEDCLEFDLAELEDYLSKHDSGNVPTISMMIGGFQCPVTALPFGALKSDWARLQLLQRAQRKDSTLSAKLARLFRILAIAYFQMEERFDLTGLSGAGSVIAPSTHKSATNTDSRLATKEPDTSVTGSGETDQATASFATSTFASNDEGPTDAVRIEGTAFSSFDVTMEEKLDDVDAILEDISSTTVTASPVDEVDEKTVTAFINITTFADVITGKSKCTATSTSGRNESTTTEAISIFNSTDDFIPVSAGEESSEYSVTVNSIEFRPMTTGSVSPTPVVTDPAVIDISGPTTGDEKSADETDPERLSTESISSSKFRGDFPVSDDREDFDWGESEDVNSLGIFHVKTTEDTTSVNGIVSSVESRSDHRKDAVSEKLPGKVPWGSEDSTDPRSESETPSIRERPPLDNDLWKHTVPSRTVTLTPAGRRRANTDRSKETSAKSRKRGSLNTNVEKNFRWFYNFGYEDEARSSYSDQSVHRPGVYIQCSGKSREDRE